MCGCGRPRLVLWVKIKLKNSLVMVLHEGKHSFTVLVFDSKDIEDRLTCLSSITKPTFSTKQALNL